MELKVRMCCTGCERVVRRSLRKLRGKPSVEYFEDFIVRDNSNDKYENHLPFKILVLLRPTRATGVDSVEVDVALEKVTVTGYVDRNKVLKAVRRSGKKAEFWPNTGQPLFFTGAADYYYDDRAYRGTYNYWRHGYNDGDRQGRVRSNYRPDDKVGNFFSDDNVHACAIM